MKVPESSNTQPKELTIIMPDNTSTSTKYRITTVQKNAKLFEQANTGVKVNVVLLPKKDYGKGLLTYVTEQKPMDLVFGEYEEIVSQKELFGDLLLFYKADRMSTDHLYKPLVDLTTVNGKLLGIPMAPMPLGVFYNKEWFKKASLPEPQSNWTWEEFFTISAKLKDSNAVAGKEIYGSLIPMDFTFLEAIAQSSGSSVLSPDGTKASGYLDHRAVTESVDMLMRDLQGNKVVKQVANSENAINVELSAGNAGMGIGKSGNYPFLISKAALKGNIGVVSLPRLEKGARANAVEIEAFAMGSSSKQQKLAWKFMKDVLLNPDSAFQQDWSKQEMLTLPAAVQKVKQDTDPALSVLYGELNYTVKSALYRNPKLKTIFSTNLMKKLIVTEPGGSVQKSFSEVAFEIDKQLAQVK